MNADAHTNSIWHKCTEVSWKSLKLDHLFLSLDTLASKEEKKNNLNTSL